MDITILFEDDSLIVIDKPPGLVVNRSDTSGEETVQEWAEDKFESCIERAGIVHRLDKETSGCLIVAKTEQAFLELQRQFKAREVRKEYIALVHGRVEPHDGTINVPLARSRYDRQKFAVTPGGRISETRYEVERVFKGQSLQGLSLSVFSLLRLYPKTGRTHQIRVHLKYFGYPIVADETYAGEDRAREDRTWCPRLFLHAEKISFTHPVTKQRVTIEAPMPNDLSTALRKLDQL